MLPELDVRVRSELFGAVDAPHAGQLPDLLGLLLLLDLFDRVLESLELFTQSSGVADGFDTLAPLLDSCLLPRSKHQVAYFLLYHVHLRLLPFDTRGEARDDQCCLLESLELRHGLSSFVRDLQLLGYAFSSQLDVVYGSNIITALAQESKDGLVRVSSLHGQVLDSVHSDPFQEGQLRSRASHELGAWMSEGRTDFVVNLLLSQPDFESVPLSIQSLLHLSMEIDLGGRLNYLAWDDLYLSDIDVGNASDDLPLSVLVVTTLGALGSIDASLDVEALITIFFRCLEDQSLPQIEQLLNLLLVDLWFDGRLSL